MIGKQFMKTRMLTTLVNADCLPTCDTLKAYAPVYTYSFGLPDLIG